MTGATLEVVAGWSAVVAAISTVGGMAALLRFFARGGIWGPVNDALSGVMLLAMIPVAVLVAAVEAERFATYAIVVAAVGMAGMLAGATLQLRLAAGRVTYESSRRRTLGAGAVVGLWYLLAGLLAFGRLGEPLAGLAILAGTGFVAVSYGFLVGDQRHPLSAVGGLVLFVASLGFQLLLAWRLLTGDLHVPGWNL